MNIIESIKKRFGLAGPFAGVADVTLIRQNAAQLSDEDLKRHIALVRSDAVLFPKERDRARAERDRVTEEWIERELDNGNPGPFGEVKEAEEAYLRILEPWRAKLGEYGAAGIGGFGDLDAAIGRRLSQLYAEQRKRHQRDGEPAELLKARAAARAVAIAQHEAFERLRASQKRIAACGRFANVADAQELAALQAAFTKAERDYEAAVRAITGIWGPEAA